MFVRCRHIVGRFLMLEVADLYAKPCATLTHKDKLKKNIELHRILHRLYCQLECSLSLVQKELHVHKDISTVLPVGPLRGKFRRYWAKHVSVVPEIFLWRI